MIYPSRISPTMTNRKTLILSLLVCMVMSVAFVPVDAFAEHELSAETSMDCKQVRGRRYVLGIEDINYFPHFHADGPVVTGYIRDFFDLFASAYHTELELKSMPVKRLYASVLKGSVDLKFPSNPLWSLELKEAHPFYYSAELINTRDVSFVRQGQAPKEIRVLGSIMGFTLPEPFNRDIQLDKLKLVEIKNVAALVDMLALERVDAIFLNREVGFFRIENLSRRSNDLVVDYRLPSVAVGFHIGTLNSPEFVACVDWFMKEHSHRLMAFKDKYGIAH